MKVIARGNLKITSQPSKPWIKTQFMPLTSIMLPHRLLPRALKASTDIILPLILAQSVSNLIFYIDNPFWLSKSSGEISIIASPNWQVN